MALDVLRDMPQCWEAGKGASLFCSPFLLFPSLLRIVCKSPLPYSTLGKLKRRNPQRKLYDVVRTCWSGWQYKWIGVRELVTERLLSIMVTICE